MHVDDFRKFTIISRLGQLDKGTKMLTLWGSPLRAHFAGMHVEAVSTDLAGKIEIDGMDGGQVIAVGIKELLGALSLMPEGNLTAAVRNAHLELKTASRRVRLRLRVDVAHDPDLKPKSSEKSIKMLCSPNDLAAPMSFLSSCTADGVDRPILTGARFSWSKSRLSLAACDAAGKAGISRSVERPIEKSFRPFVAQIGDLSVALEIFASVYGKASRRINFSSTSRKFYMFSGKRELVMSFNVLLGTWPDLSQLPRKFGSTFMLDSKRVGEVAQASMLLDDDRLVKFAVRDRRVSMMAAGQELGSYRVTFARSKEPLEDVEITLDASWLEALSHLSPQIRLEYNGQREAVRFVSKDGKSVYWVFPIYRQRD